VTSIRFASNVEILLGIFWELLEEESKERIDILACSNSVAYGSATIRESDVDGLIEKYN